MEAFLGTKHTLPSDPALAVAVALQLLQECAGTLLAEIEMGSSYSTQHLSASPEVLCPVLVPTNQKRYGQTGEGPKEGHKDYQRAGEPAQRERLMELDLFSLEKRMLMGTSSQFSSTQRAATEMTDAPLFTVSHMERTRGNGCTRRGFTSL